MKFYTKYLTQLPNDKTIFVFGSNLKGVHGAGAAKLAKDNFGAIYGQGEGLYGNSYALPTKISPYQNMSLCGIKNHVELFRNFVMNNKEKNYEYYVTQVGCGLAGHKPEDIAPLFKGIDYDLIWFDEEWRKYLE